MARKNGLALQLQAQRKQRDHDVRHHTQVFVLDLVTVTLGRMGWGPKRLADFDKILNEVGMEYGKLILDDVEDDPSMDYSKAVLDRELKRYVGDRYVPYDERYRLE